MENIKAFIKANYESWTVKLGAVSAVLVAVIAALPEVQAAVEQVWPGSTAWFVVIAMYLGRAKGLADKAKNVMEYAKKL